MTKLINVNNFFNTVKYANVHDVFQVVRCAMDPVWAGRVEAIEVCLGKDYATFDKEDSWAHIFNWVKYAHRRAEW